MSKIEVDAIDKQSGSTLTLGGSGTAVTLASGATQSGFGRNGTVNWQTTIKTGDFTAVSGEGYFINTSSGAVVMTLPSSPSAGDIVAFKDYANTFDTNNLTVNRNGEPISGNATNAIVSVEGQAITMVYADSTKGWLATDAATDADLPAPRFVTATGGTITTVCTNFKVHTFTGPGTFTVTCAGNAAGNNEVSYMVIAGGGSGGHGCSGGGGGGAGGFREGKASACSYTASPLNAPAGVTVTAQGYPVVVGGGGADVANPNIGNSGNVSSALGISSAGGGGGGKWPTGGQTAGGSGGGSATACGTGAAGNTPPVSPPQGQPGGNLGYWQMAGGGGAGGAGTPGHATCGTCGGSSSNRNGKGGGGAGVTTSINGTPTGRAGGGGGGFSAQPTLSPPSDFAPGGAGGGQGGPAGNPNNDGTANTGGGGAGSPQPNPGTSGSGGSGIVIIRYKFQ